MRTWLLVALSRVRAWWHSRREDADLDHEIDAHLSLLAEDLERRGMSPDEAARAARLSFRGLAQFKEDQRDRRGLPWLDTLFQDARYAVRLFRREPRFTTGAILTLAIGIGANTSVFSLLNGYLRPLPVPNPSEIVAIGAEVRGDEGSLRSQFSHPVVADLRARALPFSDVFAYTPWIGGLRADDRTSSFLFSAVTDNYFAALGLQPALGRLFSRGEGEHAGAPRVIVLGYSYWQQRFGGDANVLNRVVRINGQPATIVGVAPKGFLGLYAGTEMDGYVTIDGLAALDAERFTNLYENRERSWFMVLARLQHGATIAQAQQAVDVAARELEAAHPESERNVMMRVYPERLARPFPQRTLSMVIPIISLFVLALAALVLMLACMNVANLMFVRAIAREREMAVRAALGAARWRLLRQSLTESVLLAGAGGLAGVLLGLLGKRLFVAGIDIGSDFRLVVNFEFDWRVFAYTTAAVAATSVIVGLWPALRASRADASTMLHDGGRSQSGGTARQRVRRYLVVGQVAGALMLLIVAGLFVRHLREAKGRDLGFDAAPVLNARLDPHQAGYDETRTNTFYRELKRRVQAWPEAQSVSLAFSVPLGYFNVGSDVFVDGRPAAADEPALHAGCNRVDADYFATMGIPILEGRAFRDSDEHADVRVAIVNRTMADRFWPGRNALGQHFRFGRADTPPWEVVGVARDAKYVLIFEDPRPFFYTTHGLGFGSMRVLQVRANVPPASLATRLEREIHALEPDMPIADLQTMQASLSGANGFMMYRLGAYQAGALGLLGLALAMIGVYGVVSYGASQRTREIGIRVALGANPGDVARLILRQGVQLVVVGVILGLAGGVGLARVMRRFFMMSASSDAPTVAAVTMVLAALALWACYLPARRATRVDPMVALRHE